MGSGVNVVTARYLGAKRHQDVSQTVHGVHDAEKAKRLYQLFPGQRGSNNGEDHPETGAAAAGHCPSRSGRYTPDPAGKQAESGWAKEGKAPV